MPPPPKGLWQQLIPYSFLLSFLSFMKQLISKSPRPLPADKLSPTPQRPLKAPDDFPLQALLTAACLHFSVCLPTVHRHHATVSSTRAETVSGFAPPPAQELACDLTHTGAQQTRVECIWAGGHSVLSSTSLVERASARRKCKLGPLPCRHSTPIQILAVLNSLHA